MKRFENSSLGNKLKAQTDIAKKQYQKLDDFYESDKIIKKEKPTLKIYSKSDIIYNSNYSCYKYYRDSKKFDNISLESKYTFLVEFFKDSNKLNKLKNKKKKLKRKKTNVYNTASELYNDLLGTYFGEYYHLLDAKRSQKDPNPDKLFLTTYGYDGWFTEEELDFEEESVDISDMPPLEGSPLSSCKRRNRIKNIDT